MVGDGGMQGSAIRRDSGWVNAAGRAYLFYQFLSKEQYSPIPPHFSSTPCRPPRISRSAAAAAAVDASSWMSPPGIGSAAAPTAHAPLPSAPACSTCAAAAPSRPGRARGASGAASSPPPMSRGAGTAGRAGVAAAAAGVGRRILKFGG